DSCMSGHQGSGGHGRKLHQALPFHVGGGIGPESITRKSEMANHNSRVNTAWLVGTAPIATREDVGLGDGYLRREAGDQQLALGAVILAERHKHLGGMDLRGVPDV